jgi:hypothetical protein
MFVCEELAGQEAVLTVQVCEAMFRCVRELKKNVLLDRQTI